MTGDLVVCSHSCSSSVKSSTFRYRRERLGVFPQARLKLGELGAEFLAGGRGGTGRRRCPRELFIAVLRREVLGGDAGEKLHMEFPGGGAVGVAWVELGIEEADVELEAGEALLLQASLCAS